MAVKQAQPPLLRALSRSWDKSLHSLTADAGSAVAANTRPVTWSGVRAFSYGGCNEALSNVPEDADKYPRRPRLDGSYPDDSGIDLG